MKLCVFTGLAVIVCLCMVYWGEDERPITAQYVLIPGFQTGYEIWKDSVHNIESDVLYYGYNSSYIIALQKPFDPKTELSDVEYSMGNEVAYYWAIELKTDSIYGPMTETDYLEFKTKKGISNDIVLMRAKVN